MLFTAASYIVRDRGTSPPPQYLGLESVQILSSLKFSSTRLLHYNAVTVLSKLAVIATLISQNLLRSGYVRPILHCTVHHQISQNHHFGRKIQHFQATPATKMRS